MAGRYVDPGTGKEYRLSDPDYAGWLTKQSRWLKDWRRRFFILKGNKLFFSRTEDEAPHGMIDLSTCMTVKSAELKAKKSHALEVSTPEETYLMFADEAKEKDEWIGAIGRAIVQTSSTYTQVRRVDAPSLHCLTRSQ
mmetsp:Transcript_35080/g.110412  ORF Transcript_35080/g.110412 Transcript_35080/m.110412 type:complete len:138 (+) Transcript_35080:279-692(+)